MPKHRAASISVCWKMFGEVMTVAASWSDRGDMLSPTWFPAYSPILMP